MHQYAATQHCTKLERIVITRNETKVSSLVQQSRDWWLLMLFLCTHAAQDGYTMTSVEDKEESSVVFIWVKRPRKYRCCVILHDVEWMSYGMYVLREYVRIRANGSFFFSSSFLFFFNCLKKINSFVSNFSVMSFCQNTKCGDRNLWYSYVVPQDASGI